MLSLIRTLQDHDLGHLRAIAELWGFELPSHSALDAAQILSDYLLDPEFAVEIMESLPPPARQALAYLIQEGGRVPMADLVRRFGSIREMGPGRRDRSKPWRNPASALEMLWYRGLLARAFTSTPTGAQEHGFIPTDLLSFLSSPTPELPEPLGHPTQSPQKRFTGSLAAVNDATMLLASLRRIQSDTATLTASRKSSLRPFLKLLGASDLLVHLLHEIGVLSAPPVKPLPNPLRAFLEISAENALVELLQTWRDSRTWNDLAHVPGLSTAGKTWPNNPLTTRQLLLDYLAKLPRETWWDLESFVSGIKTQNPGFQRPAGDFESWYLSRTEDGSFLQGFEHWDSVDGALVRFLLRGPLHCLGACDIGFHQFKDSPTAFRLNKRADSLFNSPSPLSPEKAEPPVQLSPSGRILVPASASRVHHYQIARFCTWVDLDKRGYHFQLTPSALKTAQEQNLKLNHVRAILETASEAPIHPLLKRSLSRWERKGQEASLARGLILKVSDPEVMKNLRSDRSVSRYLGESLGPRTAEVNEKDWEKLCNAAAKLGYLIDYPCDSFNPLKQPGEK